MFYPDRVFLPVGENTDPPDRDKLPAEAEDMLNEINDGAFYLGEIGSVHRVRPERKTHYI